MLSSLTDPKVENHLISDEGERVVDEVRRHPLAFVTPVLIILLGVAAAACSFLVPPKFASVPLGIGCLIALFGVYRALAVHMDRFVITNMRVFRIHGIFTQHKATMPMSRILDISVHKPVIGRIFRYGHFVFESAAQDQGLRDIRFVGRPDERDLTIQRVIQRSGLRSAITPLEAEDEEVEVEEVESDDQADFGAESRAEPETALRAESGVESMNGQESQPLTVMNADLVPVMSTDMDTEEWNTVEIDTGHVFTDSEEMRIGRALSDPVSEAASSWEMRWPERNRMQTATELMHTHRLLITDLDQQLRPLGLTFARFEVLQLLFFDPRGALPLVELTDRLQVQANSSFASVRWLEDNELIDRTLEPGDDGEVFAEITPKGRAMTDRAGQIVADARFGLGALSEAECHQLTTLLARHRLARG